MGVICATKCNNSDIKRNALTITLHLIITVSRAIMRYIDKLSPPSNLIALYRHHYRLSSRLLYFDLSNCCWCRSRTIKRIMSCVAAHRARCNAYRLNLLNTCFTPFNEYNANWYLDEHSTVYRVDIIYDSNVELATRRPRCLRRPHAVSPSISHSLTTGHIAAIWLLPSQFVASSNCRRYTFWHSRRVDEGSLSWTHRGAGLTQRNCRLCDLMMMLMNCVSVVGSFWWEFVLSTAHFSS